MKQTNVIIISVLVAVLGFFGGMKFRDYQISKKSPNFGNGQFFRQTAGTNGPNIQNRNGNTARLGGGGGVFGEVISMEDKSVTVKTQDGSTKIVVLTDSTTFSKSADGSKSDLKEGGQVAVFGTTNSDGSVTAQSVQLNPQIRMNQQPPDNSTSSQ